MFPFSSHLEYYDVYIWNIDTKNLPQLTECKVVGDLNIRKNILQFEFITESQRENLVLGLVAIVSVVVAIPLPPSLRLQIRTWLGPRKHPAHVVPS